MVICACQRGVGSGTGAGHRSTIAIATERVNASCSEWDRRKGWTCTWTQTWTLTRGRGRGRGRVVRRGDKGFGRNLRLDHTEVGEVREVRVQVGFRPQRQSSPVVDLHPHSRNRSWGLIERLESRDRRRDEGAQGDLAGGARASRTCGMRTTGGGESAMPASDSTSERHDGQ